jgi:citrate lyase subunit beta/citryl-CoA lyase
MSDFGTTVKLTGAECLTYNCATPADLAHVRSLLFAPGSDERKLVKALGSDADAVVADLEDAVAPREKDAARALVQDVFARAGGDAGPARLVRVNGAGTPFHDDDLAAAAAIRPDAIVLPKATPDAVDALGGHGPPVIALVETAQGIRLAYEIATRPRVAALQLGGVDLAAEAGLEPRTDGLELLYARSKVVLDSAAAGLRAPFDVVHVEVPAGTALEDECRLARSLGFRGKACIHPSQVAVVNRAFTPSEDELAWARKVVDAFDEAAAAGRGAVAVDGAMIDLPVVERARRLLVSTQRR